MPAAQTLGAPRRARGVGAAAAYAVLTLHRPSNVDDPASLRPMLGAIRRGQPRACRWSSPMHPQDPRQDRAARARPRCSNRRRIVHAPAARAIWKCLGLHASGARWCSPTPAASRRKPRALACHCVTLRDSTERPITVERGHQHHCRKRARARILAAVEDILRDGGEARRCRSYGTAMLRQRIVDCLREWWSSAAGFTRPASPAKR